MQGTDHGGICMSLILSFKKREALKDLSLGGLQIVSGVFCRSMGIIRNVLSPFPRDCQFLLSIIYLTRISFPV